MWGSYLIDSLHTPMTVMNYRISHLPFDVRDSRQPITWGKFILACAYESQCLKSKVAPMHRVMRFDRD